MIHAILAADKINTDNVTPGVIGFIATAGVSIAAILLILDMNRRMRRLRYRQEAKDNVDAEVAVEKLIEETNKETGNL
jgi:hypothetical protein